MAHSDAASGGDGGSGAAALPEGAELQMLLAYLRRIKFLPEEEGGDGENSLGAVLRALPANLDTLTRLHRSHALNVPFENLIFVHPVMKGKERPIDLDSLHRRIVQRRRGGMCQEHNKLLRFHMAQLGYSCYAGLAAVVVAGSQQPAQRPLQGLVSSHNLGGTQRCDGTHQIVFVRLDGLTYLCDVGFGGFGPTQPLLLRAHDEVGADGPSGQPPPADWLAAKGESMHCGIRFRLRRGVMGSSEPLTTAQAMSHPEKDSFVGYYLQALLKQQWVDQYWFSQVPTTDAVLAACAEHTFRNHLLFTQHMVLTRPLPMGDGRMSLTDYSLKVRRDGQPTEERLLASDAERDQVLAEVFGIDLAAYP